MIRGKHSIAHPRCSFTTWTACDAELMKWKNILAERSKEREVERLAVKKAARETRITVALAHHLAHPSVWPD